MTAARTTLLALTGAALLLAPPAHADRDGSYIAWLDNEKVQYAGAPQAVEDGQAVCQAFRAGAPIGVMPQYSRQDRTFVVVAAANVLCPDQLGQVMEFVYGTQPPAPH